MIYSLQHFLILSTTVFLIGFLGVLINRKSIISILLSIELMLLAVSINFVAFSSYLNQITGQIFSIFILAIAAAESAIALAIIVLYFKNRNTINVKDINELQGWAQYWSFFYPYYPACFAAYFVINFPSNLLAYFQAL